MLALSAPAAAQTPGVFKGETINISVGYPAGGAPDLYFVCSPGIMAVTFPAIR